ncbi:hypothetical protein Fmac_011182 [Flemingia macrophylla]|uniref:Uncharacterized protein n=1 Tax=Flemingia macrophylla TaxID=520843 RepID=A0ABD1MM07_9FABA
MLSQEEKNHSISMTATVNVDQDFFDGLVAHIFDINLIIDNDITFLHNFHHHFDPSLLSFLYYESLGSAIAQLITLRNGH